jgi:hypothetical protein
VTGRACENDERGAVGGVEVLPFALLVFVAGSLLVANAWAVVDAKLTAEAAAREAGRAYVEAGDPATASGAAHRAAREVVESAGRDPGRLEVVDNRPRYVRCAVVEHRTSYRVPTVTVPLVGGFGRGLTVRGHHREVLDPFGAGLGEEQSCGQ